MNQAFFASTTASSVQLSQKRRHRIKQVCHQAVISHLEDRCFCVLVDRNDHFGVFHTGQMLDRAGDTDGDVHLWRNDFAALAGLHVVRYKTCVDDSAGSANRSAQLVSKGVQVLEVITVLHAAAAGNDDLGSGQLRAV